jgi:magnesium-transporting ATPase (P-type)
MAAELSSEGRRVLALGYTAAAITGDSPADVVPAALVVLGERVRGDAPATLRFFAEQGVAVKVISGDDARTVEAVSRKAGIRGTGVLIDGQQLPSDPDHLADVAERSEVFGRVGPRQKRAIIAALRRRGHVVAMVGDGVNDILALKEADIGIAVRSAVPATRAVAQAVLLDGFGGLPELLAEGRRVVANVERTANLFVSKTCYVLLLALGVAIAGTPFPLLPRHITFVGALTIGVPAFFLALAPNTARARSGFIARVLRFAVPAGFVATSSALCAYAVARLTHPGDLPLARTAAAMTLAIAGLVILHILPGTGTRLRYLLLVAMTVALAATMALPSLRAFLALELPSWSDWLVIGLSSGAAAIVFRLLLGREATAMTGGRDGRC